MFIDHYIIQSQKIFFVLIGKSEKLLLNLSNIQRNDFNFISEKSKKNVVRKKIKVCIFLMQNLRETY